MPLVKATLKSQLLQLFKSPPDSAAACAQAWGNAVQAYATAVVPTSATVVTAATALKASLLSAFESQNGIAAMTTAFTTFATQVGSGMSPAFVAVPPPVPLGVAAQVTQLTDSHNDAAENWATLIDDWMKTGTATSSAGGSPVNWS